MNLGPGQGFYLSQPGLQMDCNPTRKVWGLRRRPERAHRRIESFRLRFYPRRFCQEVLALVCQEPPEVAGLG
jgi:hypothetical protein